MNESEGRLSPSADAPSKGSSRTPARLSPIPVAKSGRPALPRLQYDDRVQSVDIDLAALYRDLDAAIEGEVRLDQTSRVIYSTSPRSRFYGRLFRASLESDTLLRKAAVRLRISQPPAKTPARLSG